MKKSLSLLLAIAMVFSMFASVASAADELTAQQKYDALKAKGIFSGMEDGSAGLDQDMTRAQFARVVSLLMELDLNNPPATASFSDVQPAHWAFEEVEAVKKAGVMSGYSETVFGDKDNITIEQMARVYVDALGLEVDEKAEYEGTSDWAKKYVKAAVEAGLISADADFTANATRAQLVEVSYAVAGKVGIFEPAKVSVESAVPAGVKKVTVTLDKAVDTSKATFTLKKGTQDIALDTVVWSEDKKTATLPLKDVKISQGTYTVTMGGIAESEVATNKAEFTAENETVKLIEFVTASDQIVYNKKAKVKLRSENQYGELASFSASSYSVNAANLDATLKKDDEGYLIVTLDTTASGMQQGLSMIPIYVYFDDNRVTAQKTFKLGTVPFVEKLELGELKYDNDKESLDKEGDTATVVLNLFDQYGNPVTPEQDVEVHIHTNIAPYTPALTATDDEDDDDTYKVEIKVEEKIEKAATYTVTVHAGSGSDSTTLKVASSKVATSVKIGQLDGVLAAGDKNKYVSVIATDENGVELTAAEIADNADRINLTGSGVTLGNGSKIVKVGKNKGKIHIAEVPDNAAKSVALISASILTQNTNSYDNIQITIQERRIPETLVIDSKPAEKAVLGASSDFKVIVRDQYGEKLDSFNTLYANEKNYTARVTLTQSSVTTAVYGKDDNAGNDLFTDGSVLSYASNQFGDLNDGFKFTTVENEEGTARVRVELIATPQDDPSKASVVSSQTVSIQTVKNDVELRYALESLGDLYAALDSGLLTTAQEDALNPKVAKELKVEVKDTSNRKVAFPEDRLVYPVSSNENAAQVNAAAGKVYVVGNKAGTARITAVVNAADGTTKALSTNTTVKADLVEVVSIEMKDENNMSNGATANVYTLTEIKVKDQYGIEYEKADVHAYDRLLGVRFTISDIVGDGTVTLNHSAGTVTATNVTGFVINAVSRDGEVAASTPIVIE